MRPDVRFHNSRFHKLTYLELPKCASTTIRHALNTTWDDPIYPVFTFIRYPFQRFVSACAELVKRKQWQGSTIDEFYDHVLTEGFYDRHLVPQMEYIVEAMERGLDVKVYPMRDLAPFLRDLRVNVVHLNWSDFDWHVKDPRLIQKIEELYGDDTALYLKSLRR